MFNLREFFLSRIGIRLALLLDVITFFALTSISVAAVLFMLVFLRAILREAPRHHARLTEVRERVSTTVVLAARGSCSDRAA
jgi:hypothetical protein